MTFADVDVTMLWAVVFIVLTPLVVIGTGELEGRLRYRDSVLVPAVSILRLWVLPLVAIWLVAGAVMGFSSFLVRLIASAAVIAIGADLVAIIRVLIENLESRAASGARRQVPRLLLAVPQILVIGFVAYFLAAGVWDLNVSAVFQALGVTTLIISVALQDTLSGIASGFLLMMDHPFQPGDWISSEDIEGRVVDTNWRSTRIQDRNGDIVVIPNGNLAGATIVNYDEPARLHRVVVPLQVAFVNPPTLAKDMILDAARSVPGVLEEPAPSVYVTQVDDPLMGYEVRMWVDDYGIAPRVKSDFRSLVWYMSHRHDVPLPSPAFDLYNYDGVEASVAGIPDRAELRKRLGASHLFDDLADDELDRLSAMCKPDRFEAGELVFDVDGSTSTLFTLWTGDAHLEIVRKDGSIHSIATLAAGDVFGLVHPPEDQSFVPRVMADTDCEVVSIDLDTAGPVIARNQAVVDALNQITATRTRRISRMLARGTVTRDDADAPARRDDAHMDEEVSGS